MGMQIYRSGREASPPYALSIKVECDGPHEEDLFSLVVSSAVFPCNEGYPRDQPMRSGWKFVPDGLVLCPACAGK